METYSEMQLDALRELANIGSGTAATALSSMVGGPVDVSVPSALALPLAIFNSIGFIRLEVKRYRQHGTLGLRRLLLLVGVGKCL